jgi:predicted transcriptional regulator
MNITQILKERRKNLGLSQGQLANYLGFANAGNICKLENGNLQWKIKDVVKACEFLKLKIEIIKNDIEM